LPYPDTTRTVHVGIENVERVKAAVMRSVHTTNEPVHTLQNGLIIPMENTGTRTRANGQARGKRAATLRLQSFVRLQELPIWLESAIGNGVATAAADTRTQTLTQSGGATGGTFTLEFEGQETTALDFDATGAEIETALEALSNLAPADVAVAGIAGGPWTVTFSGFSAGAPGAIGPGVLVVDDSLLTGGTNPAITVTTTTTITGAYRHRYVGGLQRGLPLSIEFFNGLYWRQMLGCRVNTMNIQGFGDQLALMDMELIGPASTKIVAPTAIEVDDDYDPIDVPMQSVYIDGLINADTVRMAMAINNNLTQRNTMDGTTSARRTRFGDFNVDMDGMVDYPAYEGSLYEAFELNTRIGAMNMYMIDDLSTVGTGTPINPYVDLRVPSPLLADTSEGSDGGETVQNVRGSGQQDVDEAATIIIDVVNDKPGSYYDPS
jgi:hypothetical protein